MVEVLAGPSHFSTSSSSSSSSSHPDPCPFCQYRAVDRYSLTLHIEAAHTEDSPFIPKDVGKSNRGYYGADRDCPDRLGPDAARSIRRRRHALLSEEDPMYVLCPEAGCEELILFVELQNHMDFHSAENLSMDQVQNQAAIIKAAVTTAATKPHKRDHHKRREGGERSERSERRRDREKDDGKHHHRSREHGRDRDGKKREAKDGKENKVTYVAPSSLSRDTDRSGLNWFERAALRIVPLQMVAVSQEPRRGERRTIEGSSSLRRSDTKHSSARRSEHKRPAIVMPLPEPSPAKVKTSKVVSRKSERSVPGIKKLGKSDLGPYAHEAQMPDWLRIKLENGARTRQVPTIDPVTGQLYNVVHIFNETTDLIPTIALLCERDSDVTKVLLCHGAVKHVGKQDPKEGGFCGYRNIQMMISFIQAVYPRGSHPFEGRIPTILKLQELIEDGWARGINASARLETGGIKGTRKYIGTSEAQTLLTSVGLRSRARAFVKSDPSGLQTQQALLNYVEEYFQAGVSPDTKPDKVIRTGKAPIYLQHSGHSMTIVGLEKWKDGTSSLLVFDPFFTPSEAMKQLIGAKRLGGKVRPEMMLKVYRRRLNYLQKYKEFEVILLDQ